jgi:hypothetical protein
VENEQRDIVEGSPPSKTREDTAPRIRAMAVGALIVLRTLALTDQKSRMMMINQDRFTPYQGAMGVVGE